MTIVAGRRGRALAALSVLTLAMGLVTACNNDDGTPAANDKGSSAAQANGGTAADQAGAHDGMHGGDAAASQVKMPLFNDLGSFTHTISTKNREAQAYFDQGYRYLFNFNHNGAILSFKEALKRDPKCAMCWWGIAFAYGPNINMPMMPEANQPAFVAVQHAQSLAANASAEEQAWIAAIAKRYTNNAKIERHTLDLAFAEAMKQVAHDYPHDLDAAVLYAEALMDTSPWDYWQADKKTPKAGLEDLVPTLEGVLKKDPRHPGAEHLYIHTVEASANPQRGERYADMLRGQMPGAGHIVHMPSHIYNRLGRYAEEVRLNQAAAKADEAYVAATNDHGLYSGMYYVHNLHFVWTSATLEGQSATALDYAGQAVKSTPPDLAASAPPGEWVLPTLLYAQLRFAKWDEVLATPQFEKRFAFANAMWHYAQARAYAAKKDVAKAQAELALIASSFPKAEAERFAGFGVPAQQLVDIAVRVAQADIARAQKKSREEIAALQEAVKLQDALPYTEPPYWDFPIREYLGAALLAAGRAKEAENVYRQDLRDWPKNGWSLFGLSEALKRQGKGREARKVKKEFDLAWERADVTLTASRF
ncbi:MAG: hypothetical protein GC190_07645 [Alphaproteobacteria bacterium]|nr:hypothetical protein [Alphaproteobacteria bacterium]